MLFKCHSKTQTYIICQKMFAVLQLPKKTYINTHTQYNLHIMHMLVSELDTLSVVVDQWADSNMLLLEFIFQISSFPMISLLDNSQVHLAGPRPGCGRSRVKIWQGCGLF